MKLYQKTCVVRAGEQIGEPIYTEGRALRFLGLPIDKTGYPAFADDVGFDGSFDGVVFTPVLDYTGAPFVIPPQAKQNVVPIDNYPKAEFIFLPIRDGAIFEGVLMVRIVTPVTVLKDQVYTLVFGLE
jgi:hypothetical protein